MESLTGVVTVNCDQGRFAGSFIGFKARVHRICAQTTGRAGAAYHQGFELGFFFFKFHQEPLQEGQVGSLLTKSTRCQAVDPAWCWSQREAKPQRPLRPQCPQQCISVLERRSPSQKNILLPSNQVLIFSLHPVTAQLCSLRLSLSFRGRTWPPHSEFILLIVKIWKYGTDIPLLKQTDLSAAR